MFISYNQAWFIINPPQVQPVPQPLLPLQVPQLWAGPQPVKDRSRLESSFPLKTMNTPSCLIQHLNSTFFTYLHQSQLCNTMIRYGWKWIILIFSITTTLFSSPYIITSHCIYWNTYISNHLKTQKVLET